MKQVYADNAATTAVDPRVLEAMMPFLTGSFGNPSSLHEAGRTARRAVEKARAQTAAALGAKPDEIFFTSGGSESDNWAIRSAVLGAKRGRHVITSRFEHPAVLQTLHDLEKQGVSVTYLEVHGDGFVRPEEVEAAIRPDTALITVMAANNEIGTIQPTAAIGQIARAHGILFHTDAVQAVGQIPMDTEAMQIDLLSLSGHKIHAPKGIGALYVRRGTELAPLITGGSQEHGMRAGTENTAGIAALGEAMQMMQEHLPEMAKVAALRDRLTDGLLKIPCTALNGSRENRLPGNVNISFRFVEGESLVLLLDMQGICCSAGSACSSGTKTSYVIRALGADRETAQSALRLSLGEYNTEEDVDFILEKLPAVVEKLREMSPEGAEICGGRA